MFPNDKDDRDQKYEDDERQAIQEISSVKKVLEIPAGKADKAFVESCKSTLLSLWTGKITMTEFQRNCRNLEEEARGFERKGK